MALFVILIWTFNIWPRPGYNLMSAHLIKSLSVLYLCKSSSTYKGLVEWIFNQSDLYTNTSNLSFLYFVEFFSIVQPHIVSIIYRSHTCGSVCFRTSFFFTWILSGKHFQTCYSLLVLVSMLILLLALWLLTSCHFCTLDFSHHVHSPPHAISHTLDHVRTVPALPSSH